jgi:hypothetical protein
MDSPTIASPSSSSRLSTNFTLNNTTSKPSAAPAAAGDEYEYESCCLFPVSKQYLMSKFTPEFFQTAEMQSFGNGHDYEDWLEIKSIMLSSSNDTTTTTQEESNTTNTSYGQRITCQTQWYMLVLSQNVGYFLRRVMNQLLERKKEQPIIGTFPYLEEQPNRPRILLLGVSISHGVWIFTQKIVSPLGKANI